MADEQDPKRIQVSAEKRNWLPWILLGLGLLALLFAASRCGRDEAVATGPATTMQPGTPTPIDTNTAAPVAAAAGPAQTTTEEP